MLKIYALFLCFFVSFAVLAQENPFEKHYNQTKEIERQKQQEELERKQAQQQEAALYNMCIKTIRSDMRRFFIDPRQMSNMSSSFFDDVCKCSAKTLKETFPKAAADLANGKITRSVEVLYDARFASYYDCLRFNKPKNTIWIE